MGLGLSRTGLSRTGLSRKKDWPKWDLAKVGHARLGSQKSSTLTIPGIWRQSAKFTMQLLKTLRRHLTVQKDLGLLNGCMLTRGEVLCFLLLQSTNQRWKLVETTETTYRSKLNGIAEQRYAAKRKEPLRNCCNWHLTVDEFHDELQLSAKNT